MQNIVGSSLVGCHIQFSRLLRSGQQSLLVGTQPVIGALNSSAPVLSTGQAIQLQTAPVAQTVQLQARNGQAVQLQQADTNGHPTPTVLGIPNNPTATVMAQQLVQVWL